MADTKYLKLQHRTWWFNIGIPADVRDKFEGKATVSENLRTHELHVAQQKRWALKAQYEERFATARGIAVLTPLAADEMARELYRATLERLQANAKANVPAEEEADALSNIADDYFLAADSDEFDAVEDDLDHANRTWGNTIEPGSDGYKMLGRAFLDAVGEALVGRSRALRGIPAEPPETFLEAPPVDLVTLKAVRREPSSSAPVAATGVRFSEASRKWLEAKTRDPATAIAAKTADTYRAKLKLFEKFVGDKPLNAVTLAMAVAYKGALASLPPSWDEKIDGEPDVRAASAELTDSTERMTGVTLSSYLSPCRSVFTWSQRHGYFDQSRANPFAGLSEPKPKKLKGKRGERLYEIAELQKLVDAVPRKRVTPATSYEEIFAWMPFIALFSGMRIGEIAQLEKGIIKHAGKIAYFDLTDARVKTAAGARIIPVHGELIRCGLLKYVTALPDGGSFWPSLERDSYGRLGHHLPDRYKLYRENIGLDADRLGMHGLRKNFNQAMIDAGVAKEIRETLMGHTTSMNMEIYGPRGPAFKLLIEAVEAVTHPGLKLRRLHT